jgi:hypothetical protein
LRNGIILPSQSLDHLHSAEELGWSMKQAEYFFAECPTGASWPRPASHYHSFLKKHTVETAYTVEALVLPQIWETGALPSDVAL